MRGFGRWMLVSAAAAALVGCHARTAVDEWAGLVHPDVLAGAGLQYYWHQALDLPDGEEIDRLWLLDENLYCLTDRNRLLAVDAARGLLKWSYVVADPGQTVFPPTHSDQVPLSDKVEGIAEMLSTEQREPPPPFDAVLINTLSNVVVLNRANGVCKRDIRFSFAAHTGGAAHGLFFYVCSARGWYYAIRLPEAIVGWWLTTDDIISAPPVFYNSRLYVAGEDGGLYANDVGTKGRRIWRQQMIGPVTAPFHVDARGCFIPCEDRRIYAFDALTGAPLWEPFVCEGPLRCGVQVGANTLFQYADRDQLYAINLVNGAKRWSRPDGRRVLTVIDGTVYLLDDAGKLLVLDEVTGTLMTSLPLTGMELFASNVKAPAVYTATRDGQVFCIRLLTAGYLTTDDLKKTGK